MPRTVRSCSKGYRPLPLILAALVAAFGYCGVAAAETGDGMLSFSARQAPPAVSDPTSDGAIGGAAVGAATLLGLAYLAIVRCYEHCEGIPPTEQFMAVSAAIGGGGGALIGWLVNWAVKCRPAPTVNSAGQPSRRLAVQAPRIDLVPVVARARRGMWVVVTF